MRRIESVLLRGYMESSVMNEIQIKELCKFAVEYGRRPLSHIEKETVKFAIDYSSNVMELSMIALLYRLMGK